MPKPKPRSQGEATPSLPQSPRRLIVELRDQGQVLIHHDGISELESPVLLRIAAQIVERKLGIRE